MESAFPPSTLDTRSVGEVSDERDFIKAAEKNFTPYY